MLLHRQMQLAEEAPSPALAGDPGGVGAEPPPLPRHPRHDGPDVVAHDRWGAEWAWHSPAVGGQPSLELEFPSDLGE